MILLPIANRAFFNIALRKVSTRYHLDNRRTPLNLDITLQFVLTFEYPNINNLYTLRVRFSMVF